MDGGRCSATRGHHSEQLHQTALVKPPTTTIPLTPNTRHERRDLRRVPRPPLLLQLLHRRKSRCSTLRHHLLPPPRLPARLPDSPSSSTKRLVYYIQHTMDLPRASSHPRRLLHPRPLPFRTRRRRQLHHNLQHILSATHHCPPPPLQIPSTLFP